LRVFPPLVFDARIAGPRADTEQHLCCDKGHDYADAEHAVRRRRGRAGAQHGAPDSTLRFGWECPSVDGVEAEAGEGHRRTAVGNALVAANVDGSAA
jgi:hypothetical protein